MAQTQTKIPLSILYLRCHVLRICVYGAQQVVLSILYLRCGTGAAAARAVQGFPEAFNSLFEMLSQTDVEESMRIGRFQFSI